MTEPLVERSLLEDLGFERCKNEAGWGHEVWYHKVDFWVHYDEEPPRLMYYHEVNALSSTRKEFFQKFLRLVEGHFIESSSVSYTPIFQG